MTATDGASRFADLPPPDGSPKDLLYFKFYLERCWAARQYYKDEENKLLYGVGGAFVAVVAATGLLGGIREKDAIFAFSIWHVVTFHLAFTVAWFFYLYKKLNTVLFGFLGQKVEHYVQQKYGVAPPGGLPSFFEIKNHYLGRELSSGRGLSNIANILGMLIYLITVTSTVCKGELSWTGVSINWASLVSGFAFLLFLGAGQAMFEYQKRRFKKRIQASLGTSAENGVEG